MTARPLVLGIAALLLLAGAALLLHLEGVLPWAVDEIEREPAEADASPALLEPGAEPSDAPALAGRARSTLESQAPRGVAVTVTVIGPFGHRLQGQELHVAWSGGDASGTTDADGVARLEGVPIDGSALLHLRRYPKRKSSVWDTEVTVDASEIEVRVPYGLPLEVLCVDAEGGWRHADARWAVLPSVGANLSLVRPGMSWRVTFRVEAPEGWLAWDPVYADVTLSRWARRLVAHYPLRREAGVQVTVLDHQGRPESEATVHSYLFAGRELAPRQIERVAAGVFRFRGIPFFWNEPFAVTASAPYLQAAHPGWARLPAHPADRAEVIVRLPSAANEEPGVHIDPITMGPGGRGGAMPSWLCAHPGSLRVRVTRRNGEPAAGATLWHLGHRKKLDDRGEVLIEQLNARSHEVRVHAPGLLPMRGMAEVIAGRETLLELREPDGGVLEVLVVDEHHDPLPFASLALVTPTGEPWVDEQDGVQRVDSYVDHQGRRRLEHVETGRIEITATWATRSATKKVEVRERDTARVEIVLASRP